MDCERCSWDCKLIAAMNCLVRALEVGVTNRRLWALFEVGLIK